jgi:hypothetical protein
MSAEGCWCRFVFVPNGNMSPEILVRDSELDPDDPLFMDAQPA